MIRPAKFADIPRLVDLGRACMAAGRYKGTDLNTEAAKSLLLGAIASHKETPEIGSVPVFVSEHGDLTGMIIGSFQPAYLVLDEMVVSDLLWWVDRETAAPRDGIELLNALHEWADRFERPVRRVHTINDAVMNAQVLRRMFLRMGYRESGYVFEKEPEK